MPVSKTPRGEDWSSDEDDFDRHSLIYHLLDLGGALLEIAFDHAETRAAFAAAQEAARKSGPPPRAANGDEDEEAEFLPLCSWRFDDAADGAIHLAGRADDIGFFLRAETSEFEATVMLIYDPEEGGLLGGGVMNFSGHVMKAIQWARDRRDDIDAGDFELDGRR